MEIDIGKQGIAGKFSQEAKDGKVEIFDKF
jgi:hypothetical protein